MLTAEEWRGGTADGRERRAVSVGEHQARIRALEAARRKWIGALLGSAMVLFAFAVG